MKKIRRKEKKKQIKLFLAEGYKSNKYFSSRNVLFIFKSKSFQATKPLLDLIKEKKKKRKKKEK